MHLKLKNLNSRYVEMNNIASMASKVSDDLKPNGQIYDLYAKFYDGMGEDELSNIKNYLERKSNI